MTKDQDNSNEQINKWLEEKDFKAIFLYAEKLFESSQFKGAICIYDQLIEKYQTSDNQQLMEQAAKASVNKGFTLGKLEKYEDSIHAYDSVIEKFKNQRTIPAAVAMFFKGFTLGELEKYEDSIRIYDSFIEQFQDFDKAQVLEYVANAMFFKGSTLGKLKKYQDSIKAYDSLIEKFQNTKKIQLLQILAKAMFNNGVTLWKQGNSKNAIRAYNSLIETFQDFHELNLLEPVARAMLNKGVTLGELVEYEDAIQTYDSLIEKFQDSKEDLLRKQVVMAKSFKAHILRLYNNFDLAAQANPIDYLAEEELESRDKINKLLNIIEQKRKHLLETLFSFEQDKDKTTTRVTHFTSIEVLRSVLEQQNLQSKDIKKDKLLKNRLRLYNTIYANDPLEGHTLILRAQNKKYSLASFFKPEDGCENCPTQHNIYHSKIYSVSFTRDTDSLPLWRAYGKDGKGIGIIIPIEDFHGDNKQVFEQFTTEQINKIQPSFDDDENASKDVSIAEKIPNPTHLKRNQLTLYKVIYGHIDHSKSSELDSILNMLEPELEKLKVYIDKTLPTYTKKCASDICEIIQSIIAPILYLCKDHAYESEHEYRVFFPAELDNDLVSMDAGGRETETHHTYIPTEPFLFEKPNYEIYIGPKIQDQLALQQEIRWRLTKNGFDKNTDVKISEIQYR